VKHLMILSISQILSQTPENENGLASEVGPARNGSVMSLVLSPPIQMAPSATPPRTVAFRLASLVVSNIFAT